MKGDGKTHVGTGAYEVSRDVQDGSEWNDFEPLPRRKAKGVPGFEISRVAFALVAQSDEVLLWVGKGEKAKLTGVVELFLDGAGR